MKRKAATIAISLGMAFVLSACSAGAGSGAEGAAIEMSFGETQGWVDSDLIGSVTADREYRLQDDFAAAVNKEWKLEAGDKYSDVLQKTSDTVLAKMKKAATDESIPGEEAEVLRKYYELSSDWGYRDNQGADPLKPYIEDIATIDTQEELFAFFGDLDRNPLGLAPIGITVMDSDRVDEYPDINLTVLGLPSLSLTDPNGRTHYNDLSSVAVLDFYEGVENKALYMLDRVGYSGQEAKKMFRNCLLWEKNLFAANMETEKYEVKDLVKEHDQATALAGSFPLGDLLDAWGFGDTEFIAVGPEYAKKLSSLCDEGNLEKIKDYLIVNYCLKSANYLDRGAKDIFAELGKSRVKEQPDYGMSEEQKEDELQFNKYIGETAVIGALNKTYVENYFDEAMTSELISLTEDLIDTYRVIFSEEPWLSEEGKAACLEKLENIEIHVAHQSFEVLDYSKTPFLSKEEGGSFLDAYFAMSRYSMYHKAFLSTQKFRRDYWDPVSPGASTTQTNAFYNPVTNGIYICAGICEEDTYSPNMTYEEKLAGLCSIVGHEITHGFDKNGSLYDKDGMKNTWLPYEDQYAFSDLNDKVSAYYSTLTPYPGSGIYNGQNLTGEATADMGGIKATLYLAAKVPDFDYDLYFRSFARLWRMNVPLESEKERFSGDVHPLSFYRVNVGLQQFDEFYETYGIKEGDKMYLDPDKRIKVW